MVLRSAMEKKHVFTVCLCTGCMLVMPMLVMPFVVHFLHPRSKTGSHLQLLHDDLVPASKGLRLHDLCSCGITCLQVLLYHMCIACIILLCYEYEIHGGMGNYTLASYMIGSIQCRVCPSVAC